MWIDAKTKAEIKKAVESLREIERKVFGPRHGKADFYEYLDGVFKLYRQWRKAGQSKKRANQLASLFELKIRKNTHPIRAIIDASSQQNRGVRSRWTRALQYADKHRSQVREKGLIEFFEANGGVWNCARQIAKESLKKA